jgi:branched-subunit amino acid transport protein
MNEVYLVTGMAVVTFLIRYIMHPASGRMEFSKLFIRMLAYVPPAVLTAIIMPAIICPSGQTPMVSFHNPYLIGGIGAFIVGWLTKNLLLTIMAGMGVFLFWQWILGAWL